MKGILMTLLATINLSALGQDVTTWTLDSFAVSIADDLIESHRTDEVLIFQSGCIGCEVLDDKCECFDGHSFVYLIWLADEKIWSTEINCCLNIDEKELYDINLWKYFLANKHDIFDSVFKADIYWSHYDFWFLRSIPSHPKRLQYFNFHLDDQNPFVNTNKLHAANRFRINLQKEIYKVWK